MTVYATSNYTSTSTVLGGLLSPWDNYIICTGRFNSSGTGTTYTIVAHGVKLDESTGDDYIYSYENLDYYTTSGIVHSDESGQIITSGYIVLSNVVDNMPRYTGNDIYNLLFWAIGGAIVCKMIKTLCATKLRKKHS